MLKIVSAPNPVLSEPAKQVPLRQGFEGQVSKIDKSILNLISEMKQTLNATHDPEGVGLAAPQVGKNLQIFISKPTRKSRIQVFINPKVLSKKVTEESPKKTKKGKHIKLEGCLSLPNIWGEVERSNEVEVEYINEKGEKHTKLFKGFPATIIQHEYDHLQGTLFPKRVLEQKGQLYKSSKNQKGEDVFEEIEI